MYTHPEPRTMNFEDSGDTWKLTYFPETDEVNVRLLTGSLKGAGFSVQRTCLRGKMLEAVNDAFLGDFNR